MCPSRCWLENGHLGALIGIWWKFGDAWHDMRGTVRHLLGVSEEVVRPAIQHHAADHFQWDQFFRNQLGCVSGGQDRSTGGAPRPLRGHVACQVQATAALGVARDDHPSTPPRPVDESSDFRTNSRSPTRSQRQGIHDLDARHCIGEDDGWNARAASHQVSERVKTADAKCRTRFTFAVRRTATRGGTRSAPHRGRRLVPRVFSTGQTLVSESLILCRMANGPSLPSAWWTRAELPMNRSDDD
jgi:hypothetical protein